MNSARNSLARVGWAFAALFVLAAWMPLVLAPILALEGPLYRFAYWIGAATIDGRSPLLAWVALPFVTGGWLYLLLWVTRRAVKLNDSIYRLTFLLSVLTALLPVAVWIGIGEPSGGYVLFGYDPGGESLTSWSLWMATAAASLGAALYVFRKRNRVLADEVCRRAHDVASHA